MIRPRVQNYGFRVKLIIITSFGTDLMRLGVEQVDPALASNRLWDTMLKSGTRAMIEFQVRSDKSVDQ
jgi:hypothetical protein